MKSLNWHNDVARTYIIALVVAGIVLLWLRMGPPIQVFIKNGLVFEDGSIFLGSALKAGWYSILEPYAGYLHVYPRLISIVAMALPLDIAPHVFFLGWTAAFGVMLYVIVIRSLSIKSGMTNSILIALLVSVQPHGGEVFFSLTNSQWFLAVALILYFCVPVPSVHPRLETLFVALLSLTGPFSVLLLPVLLFRVVVRRDFQQYRWPYIAILFAAAVQAGWMVTSSITAPPTNNVDVMSTLAASNGGVMDWVGVAGRFVFFGGHGPLVVVLSTVFWALFCFLLLKVHRQYRCNTNEVATIDRASVFSLVMVGCIILMAGLIKNKSILHLIGPLTGGARYFFIPYALIVFLAVTLSTGWGVLRYILLSTFVVICAILFVKIDRANLHYRAYLHLAQSGHFVSIPFYPAGYAQPLEIKAGLLYRKSRGKEILQTLVSDDLSIAAVLDGGAKDLGLPDKACGGCTYITDIGNKCKESPVASLEFIGWLSEPGIVKVQWGNKDWQGYERYYSAGENPMQFAFISFQVPIQYKVTTVDGKNVLKISQVKLLCFKQISAVHKP